MPRFNPANSIEFDLTRGQIALRGAGERLLIPADAFAALWQGAEPEARKDFAQRLGTEIGRRVLERLGSPAEASVESVVEHFGGELALMGFGSLGLERWGSALVLTVADSPLGAGGDDVLSSLLEGALQRGFARDVGVVRLTRDASRARFLATSREGASRAREWLGAGSGWADVLTRLNVGARGDA